MGAGPVGQVDRGKVAPRQVVEYFCARQHRSEITFAVEAVVPENWDCPKCGMPSSLDALNPPPDPKATPYKTHLAYVKERRSETEAESLLDDAVKQLRSRRRSGEVGR